MKLGIVCFKCNDCGTLSYPPQHSEEAEKTLVEEYTYQAPPSDLRLGGKGKGPEKRFYGLAQIIDPADVPGIPDDASVEERKTRLEELKDSDPSQFNQIVNPAKSEYGKWRSDFMRDKNSEIDNREAELKSNAKSVSRSEQPHKTTLKAERSPAEVTEQNGTVIFECPNCGRELARASKP